MPDDAKGKLEQLYEKREKLNRRIREEKSRESKSLRKQRTRNLIQIGGLIEIVGLVDADKGALLGAFIEIDEKIKENPSIIYTWKKAGDALLEKREAERKGKTKNE